MFIPILAFVVAAIAFGVVGLLLARRWGEVRLLDPMTIKEEQERKKREAMILRRFERVRADQVLPFRRIGRAIGHGTKNLYRKAYRHLLNVERMYKSAKSPFASMAPSGRERMKTLISEARTLMRDLKWAEAERRLLEVVSMDQHHADAYKLLGQLYLRQKLYPQATETFQFLLKMKKADDATYAGFAEIAEAAGDFTRAEAMRLKAVEVSPRNAFRQAELAEFYVEQKTAEKAWPAIRRACELEPTSAKYLEASLQVALELKDGVEARRRYDRLRLLSDDRSRFQSLREKVEALEATLPKQVTRRRWRITRSKDEDPA
jgi:tetratricopeptide (TPR) repeat protein